MPETPPRPAGKPDRSRGSWLSLGFTGLILLLVLTALLMAPLGRIGIAILIGSMIFPVVIGFHYFVWGRLMQRMLSERSESEEDGE